MGAGSAKVKRGIAYSVVILLVLGAFVMGYFFYFVPLNKKAIHNNGFLILNTIAGNINAKVEGHKSLLGNFYNTDQKIYSKSANDFFQKNVDIVKQDTIEKINNLIEINNRNLTEDNQVLAQVSSLPPDTNQGARRRKFKSDEIKVNASIASSGHAFLFSIQDTILVSEPAEQFLRSVFQSQKSELFSAFFVGHVKNKKTNIIYYDKDLAIRSDRDIDSFLPNGAAAFLPGIQDLQSDDMAYKMFYFPFKNGDEHLVLYGLVQTEKYNSFLRRVPFYFVFPLTILFLLILFTFPIIKFNLMDSNEPMHMRDIIFFGMSVFLSAGLITLIIIHALLWKGAERRAEDNLASLAAQLKNRFKSELLEVSKQIDLLDEYRKKHFVSDTSFLLKTKKNEWDFSPGIKSFINTFNDLNYYPSDRVSWINSDGNQAIKAEMSSIITFTNVKKRSYFKAFYDGTAYSFSDAGSDRFGFEPLYSWTNTGFNVSVSKYKEPVAETDKSDEWIVTLATRMFSMTGTIMPLGYGFCIINDQGDVLLHSDENRNLNENFFKKIEPAWKIKNAVASRQWHSANDVIVYSKQQMVHVEALENLPFHVVTFYDKGGIMPVNMRILLFALVFGFLVVVTCIALWLTMVRKPSDNHPLLFCSLDCMTWLMPRRRDTGFYIHASIYLLFYIVLLLLFVFVDPSYSTANTNIPALLIMSPLNVVFGLFTIRQVFAKPVVHDQSKEKSKWKQIVESRMPVFTCIGILALLSSLVWFAFVLLDFTATWVFGLFQVSVIALLTRYLLADSVYAIVSGQRLGRFKKLCQKMNIGRADYPFSVGYVFMLTCLIICLSVLPNALYTWYAHNQELIQMVKSQQLNLADAIKDRSNRLAEMRTNKKRIGARLPDSYFDSLLFSKGIYTINQDTIVYGRKSVMPGNEPRSFEDFYFSVAASANNIYYDDLTFGDLKDAADDNAWQWRASNDTVYFQYEIPIPCKNLAPKITNNTVQISSVLPSRFPYFNFSNPVPFFFIILLAFLLLAGLYAWLKKNTARIFLLRFVYDRVPIKNEIPLPDGSKLTYRQTSIYTDSGTKFLQDYSKEKAQVKPYLYSRNDYRNFTTSLDREALFRYETKLVADVDQGNEFYKAIWEKCSVKEHCMLHDFAKDGLMNYKNTFEIMELIQKNILVVVDERLRLFSPGFRAYILTKLTAEDVQKLHQFNKENSSWETIRLPLLIFLLGIATIIFFAQQGVFDKLLVLAGGMSTLLTFVMKFAGGETKTPVKKE